MTENLSNYKTTFGLLFIALLSLEIASIIADGEKLGGALALILLFVTFKDCYFRHHLISSHPIIKFTKFLYAFVFVYVFASNFPITNPIFSVGALFLIIACAVLQRHLFLAAIAGIALSFSKKNYDGHGIWITETDWSILGDMALFLPVFFSIMIYATKTKFLSSCRQDNTLVIGAAVFTLLTLHMANYFYASVAKIELSNDFSWIFNYTPNITAASIILEQNPLLQLFFSNTHLSIKPLLNLPVSIVIAANAFVLFSQLFSPLALARAKLVFCILIVFEIFHFSVLAASGIFFYKWIFINILLCILLSQDVIRFAFEKIASTITRPLIAVFMILSCYEITYIPKLGWYDSNTVIKNQILIEIDGKYEKLPSNAFLKYSVVFAQHRVSPFRYPIGAYGATSDQEYMFTDCENAADKILSKKKRNNIQFELLFEELHKYLLDASERLTYYDLFPHHIWADLSGASLSTEKLLKAKNFAIRSTLFCFSKEELMTKPLGVEYYGLQK